MASKARAEESQYCTGKEARAALDGLGIVRCEERFSWRARMVRAQSAPSRVSSGLRHNAHGVRLLYLSRYKFFFQDWMSQDLIKKEVRE